MAQTVQPGQAAQFTVGATGEGALVYQWRRNGVDIANAVRPFLKIAGASAGDAGSYSVVVRNAAGGVESTAATLTLDAAAEGRLVNLSSLSFSGAGVDQLVPGFVAEGTVRLLVRAVGPSLAGFGVTGPLADPFLHIARSGEFVASNDDWGDNGAGSAIMDAASRVGGFALAGGSADSALLFDYEGGPRSAPVSDSGGGSGAALVEVYEVPTEGRNGRLVNLATRGLVVADGTLVAGFVIGDLEHLDLL